MTSVAPSLHRCVLDALGGVRDPELDQPITELGFVRSVRMHTRGVEVTLRLPTYFCVPNFAYLMVADAQDAVSAVPGVSRAEVQLVDHFAADEINAGISARAEPAGTNGRESGRQLGADGGRRELAELRLIFMRKAYLAALDRLCTQLRTRGYELPEIVRLRIGELPGSPQRDSLLRRRADLGLPADSGAPVLLDEHGERIDADQAPLRLRFARSVRLSIDGNASFCQGLLHTGFPGQRHGMR